MQNKNNKSVAELRRTQKVSKVITPVIKSRILFTQHSQFNENTKISSSHNLVVPYIEGNQNKGLKDSLEEEKLQEWHKQMIKTFENFLHQLDELFMNLRTEKRLKTLYCMPAVNSYKDICEKLRLEILIAIDKLELTNTKGNLIEKNMEFLHKMNVLKLQLSQIRWQYHQAIQELNMASK